MNEERQTRRRENEINRNKYGSKQCDVLTVGMLLTGLKKVLICQLLLSACKFTTEKRKCA